MLREQPPISVLRYRWEFLRRNADFRSEVNSVIEPLREWCEIHGWWYDPATRYTKSEIEYLREHSGPTFKLKKEWDISRIVPYEWSFNLQGQHELRPGVYVDVPERFWLTSRGGVHRLENSDLETKPADWEEIGEAGRDLYPIFQADLGCSVQTCLEQFETELRKARREYKSKYGRIPQTERRPRRRLDQYDSYLRVWDLKQNEESFPQIAKKLYPKEHALDRVQDHYRRAKELISGGYRELE